MKFSTTDCETDPFLYGRVPKPFIWGYQSETGFREFYSTADFVAFIHSIKQPRVIFAHNGGKFDYHFLLQYVEDKQNILVINGRLSKFKIGKCEFRDSYNILPVPLASIEKDDFDYTKLEADVRDKHMPEIVKYLKGDCFYLYQAIEKYVSEYGDSITQAASAFKYWQQLTKSEPPKSGEHYYNQFAPYYSGGRVTPFRTGIINEPFEIYDINSAYPYAMLFKHPIGLEYVQTKHVKDRHLERALIKVECDSLGCLPFRKEKGGLEFPHRRDVYTVTGWEFIAGLETGAIKNPKILTSFIFKEMGDFKPYVDHFYRMKLNAEKSGNKTNRLFAKLFLNSLYGKFGANPDNYRNVILTDFKTSPGERRELVEEGYKPGMIIGNMQIWEAKLRDNEKTYYNVATAASITGFVRAYLWRSLQQVESPIYCDTDSIICKRNISLPLGDQLGQWDCEGKGFKIAVAGKKLYAAYLDGGETKTATKGARLSAAEIVRVAKGETVRYENFAPTFGIKKAPHFISRNIKLTVDS